MPWSVSESPLGRRLPVTSANAMGGYNRAMMPNPNDPVANLRRGFKPAGDPRQPANVAQLQMDAERTSQAEAAKDAAYGQQMRTEGRMDTVGAQSIHNLNRGAQASSPWTLFLQAMKNQGVDHVTTGAAARPSQGGSGEPGFYEHQDPSIAGVLNASQMNRRSNVVGSMANYNTGSYQDSRRR